MVNIVVRGRGGESEAHRCFPSMTRPACLPARLVWAGGAGHPASARCVRIDSDPASTNNPPVIPPLVCILNHICTCESEFIA